MNFNPILASSTITFTNESAEQVAKDAIKAIDEAIESESADENLLSGHQTYKKNLRSRAEELKTRISTMCLMGCSADEIALVAKAAIFEIKSIRQDYLLKTTVANEKITDCHNRMCKTQFNIKNHSFEPENFGPDKDLEDIAEDYVKGKIKRKVIGKVTTCINNHSGKPATIAFKIILKTVLGEPLESCENPTRDLIISSAVSVGISEVISLAYKRTPVYLALTSAHVVHDVASVLEHSTNKIAQNEEIKELWNYGASMTLDDPRFETSMFLARNFLTGCKAPGELLQAVQEKISTTVANLADDYGLTEKNLVDIFDRSMQAIAKINPELYEEMYWTM